MPPTRRQLMATFLAASASGLAGRIHAQTPDTPPGGQPQVLKAGDSGHVLTAGAPPLRLWTYNGSFPGPLLRVRAGDTTSLRLHNTLTQPTSLHLPGAHLTTATDGVAGLSGGNLAPGETRDIAFIVRDTGTCLYRPIAPEHAAEQVERGLGGLLVADEAKPPYADDFVLVLDDIALDDAGQVREDFDAPAAIGLAGRLGNRLLVNGATTPERLTRPPGRQVRIRLANVANARPLTLGFDNMNVQIIAADSQPVDDPFPPANDRLTLAPGSRADIVITTPPAGKTGVIAARLGNGLPLLELTGDGPAEAEGRGKVAPLPPNPHLPPAIDLAAARRFDIAIGGGLDPRQQDQTIADAARVWTLGGTAWADAAGRPLFRVPRGATVVLALANQTPFLQVLHLHGHHSRQLHGRDDGWEPYWVDTIPISPEQTVRVVFIADTPGRWLIGSAVLDRLGAGLAGWFAVD